MSGWWFEDEQGQTHTEKQVFTEEVTSKAHRIRYSRNFFPERVSDLRARLFAGLENETMEQAASGECGQVSGQQDEHGLPLDTRRSSRSRRYRVLPGC